MRDMRKRDFIIIIFFYVLVFWFFFLISIGFFFFWEFEFEFKLDLLEEKTKLSSRVGVLSLVGIRVSLSLSLCFY